MNKEDKNPTTNTLQKIASALGVSVDELFKEEPERKDNSNRDDDDLDEDIRAIARNMKNLSPQTRKFLSQLVKTMSEEADKALKE